MDIRSEKCSVCGKGFADGDDVVVCPECGAPYHRACYEKAGGCVFQARHGAGFAYESQHKAANAVRCANCGAENDPAALFCINCGTPMGAGQAAPPPQPQYGYGDPLGMHQPGMGAYGIPPIPASFDGIPSADWAQYIGNSAQYYLMQFQRMDHLHRRTSFCWSALFVPPAYFLYRRMWGWGILATVLTVLFSLPGMLLIAADAGMALPIATSVLETLSMACFYLNWVLSFVCALYAFWLYRRHAARKMAELREESSDEQEYRTALLRKGGPCVPAVLALVVLLIALSVVFMQWVGIEALEASGVFSMYAI